jgi:hypothetical protein
VCGFTKIFLDVDDEKSIKLFQQQQLATFLHRSLTPSICHMTQRAPIISSPREQMATTLISPFDCTTLPLIDVCLARASEFSPELALFERSAGGRVGQFSHECAVMAASLWEINETTKRERLLFLLLGCRALVSARQPSPSLSTIAELSRPFSRL